jgi:hypothetical protein
MKRASLLALTLSFVFACSPQPATNGNGRGNINANANANVAAGARPPANIMIVITLGNVANSADFQFTVAPDCPKSCPEVSIQYLDQVQWVVANPANLKLTNVHITNFKEAGGKTGPFGGGTSFDFPLLSPQTAQSKLSGTARGSFQGNYKYDVEADVELATGPVHIKLDPRVIITD